MRRRRRKKNVGAPVCFVFFQDIITCVTGIIVLVMLLMSLELVTRIDVGNRVSAAGSTGIPDVEVLRRQVRIAEIHRDSLREQTVTLREVLGQRTASPLVTSEQMTAVRDAISALERRLRELREQARGLDLEVSAANETLLVARKAEEAAAQQEQLARHKTDVFIKSKRVVMLAGEGNSKSPLIVDVTDQGLIIGAPDSEGELKPLTRWFENSLEELPKWCDSRDKTQEYFLVMVRPDAVGAGRRSISLIRAAGFDVGWEPIEGDVLLFADGDVQRLDRSHR